MSYFTDKQNNSPCPCGSGRKLSECCGKFIDLDVTPTTAVEVMRARYTAFALGHEPWLKATWDAKKRPSGEIIDPQFHWLGLKIVSAKDIDDKHATVEFIARARVGNTGAVRHHEVSRFEKHLCLWYYVDGDVLEK